MFIKTKLNHLLMNMVNLLSLIFIDIQKKKFQVSLMKKLYEKNLIIKLIFSIQEISMNLLIL